jgi:hypothetical protein
MNPAPPVTRMFLFTDQYREKLIKNTEENNIKCAGLQ